MCDIVVSEADDHADFGSVTILFNQLGGLQVRNPSSHEWKYVKPQSDSAIITIGDSLIKLLGERVHRGLHRVVGMFSNISGVSSTSSQASQAHLESKPKLDLPDILLSISRDLTGISRSRAPSIQMMASKRSRQMPGLLNG